MAIIAIVVYFASQGSDNGSDGSSSLNTTATSDGLTSGTSLNPSTTLDASASPVVTSVSQEARDKRTVLKGNGDDTVTVMVYMCATDLESGSGFATADLNEMLYAQDSDRLNIVIETGGTSRWRNTVISNTTNQRYRVTSKGLELVQDNLGRRSMVDPATLSDFIQYSKAKYPATATALGGGPTATCSSCGTTVVVLSPAMATMRTSATTA